MAIALSRIQSLKVRKSLGVPITLAVHRILRAANAARDTAAWDEAAGLYRQALDLDPELAHIWIQYGHMLRKIAAYDTAEAAYLRAQTLGGEADALLHLGHLCKETGRIGAAARAYLQSARADPQTADAIAELRALMDHGVATTTDDLINVLQLEHAVPRATDQTLQSATREASGAIAALRLKLLREDRGGDDTGLDLLDATSALLDDLAAKANAVPHRHVAEHAAMVFDVSDLISYFRDARLPTGIQRVQIETIASALDNAGAGPVRICAFVEHRDEWVEIPPAIFGQLSRMSLESGDRAAPDWVALLTRLRLAMTVADPLVFPDRAFLINLGTSWWLQNYFLYIRKAKAEHNIRYVPFVHDLIPIMAGEHCTKELTQDFISWAIGAFAHADFFLVNSEATKRDLLGVARHLGYDVSPEDVTVTRLDADFRKTVTPANDTGMLSRWGLRADRFVLFVSTVESRKNHLGAFDAWINLVRKHGVGKVPHLVCVGNRGWLNDAVYARLDSHEALRSRVTMLSGLSDAELDLLYRSCLFTLYPSNYEGWGLPVTESLCYGKVPLIADSSSLPEAGGEFAAYFEAGSTARLTEALDSLIFDSRRRRALERRIVAEFKPRRWGEIADQIATTLQDWSARTPDAANAPQAPLAEPGAYHPIVRNVERRIWPGLRSGEVYRAGAGWWGPDNWGCWTKPDGGDLEIALPGTLSGPIRFYLQIHGLPSRACGWTLRLDSAGIELTGTLAPGAFQWVVFEIDELPADRTLRFALRGEAMVDLRTVTDGTDPRIVSVGVAGFFYCASDDAAARMALLEAVSLGTLDSLAFNREPIASGKAVIANRV